ncbi:MAG TPA: beta-propeller fold lactonase family protein [bacterium]
MKTVHYAVSMILGLSLVLAPMILYSQNSIGVLSKPNLQPYSVAVYEGGNQVFVADDASGNVLIYDVLSLAELGSVQVGKKIYTMTVDEASGKLYAGSVEQQKIAVVNAATGEFLKYLDGNYANIFSIESDPALNKIYALSLNGLTQIDIATDAETEIPGLGGGGFEAMAVNPVTHEVFVTRFIQNELVIVNGNSLDTTRVSGLGGAGIGLNWLENKVYISRGGGVGVPYLIYDRDDGSVKEIFADNDALDFFFDETTNLIYTDSEVNAIVTIIDGATDDFSNFPMASPSLEAAFLPATSHVYFTNIDFTAVLDRESELLELIPVNNPQVGGVVIQSVAVHQGTGRVFVINDSRLNFVTVIEDTEEMMRPPVYLGGSTVGIQVMDPVSRLIGDNWFLGGGSEGMVVRPGGGRVYAPAGFSLYEYAGSGSSSRLNVIELGTAPAVPAISPDGKKIYVPAYVTNKVLVVDLDQKAVIDDIDVASTPWGTAMSPDGAKLYVGCRGFENVVAVIDVATNTVSKEIPLKQPPAFQATWPWGLAINPSGTKLYVANNLANTVSVINTITETVAKTIAVGTRPYWMTVTPDGRHIFVTNGVSATVSIIDTGTDEVIHTATAGPDPRGIGALPDGSAVFVVNHNSFSEPSLSIINPLVFSVVKMPLPEIGVRSMAVADPTAKIAGRVTFDGEPVVGAILLAMQGDQQRGTATTNAAGDYSVFNLRPGVYDIHVDAENLPFEIVPDQHVGAGQTTIVHFNLGTTAVEEETTPATFHLSQNFPNPFNPATIIRYQLGQRSKVVLAIFDVRGNEIAVLVNDQQDASQYEISWQPSGVSSGIYFYRLQVGDWAATRKLLFIR